MSSSKTTLKKKLLIASDHGGFHLKKYLIEQRPDIEWIDLGPASDDRVDYPDFADLVAGRVNAGEDMGVLVCGSGQGMAIRANKYPQVRAALCWNEELAQLSRGHNNANILCLGERVIEKDMALKILDVFLSSEFEGGRHSDRVQKISQPVE